MNKTYPYQVQNFNLKGLIGISEKTFSVHFKLYEAYVKQANLLTEKLAAFRKSAEIDMQPVPKEPELEERLKFERNGMNLHELYFDNLQNQKSGALSVPAADSLFMQQISSRFGSFEEWKKNFFEIGKKRGVGWVVCCVDSAEGLVSNHWISLHDLDVIKDAKPILVMDVWEHAYLFDYDAKKKEEYITAFFANIDWATVVTRFEFHMNGFKENLKKEVCHG